MTLYKHGLGFFERGGLVDGESLRLEFPRRAMDDVLKSLVAIDQVGRVLGLEFETPEDRNPNVARPKLDLSDGRGLTELLNALKGRAVRLEAGAESLEGLVVGVELEDRDHLERGLVVVFDAESKRVSSLRLDRLERVSLLDDAAANDLVFALGAAIDQEERASAVLQLSSGNHDLSVSYIAPAPAWRVSYRLISDEKDGSPDARSILLQAWGLFDNTLEEDLEGVQLTLMAGMPVSFRYVLHQPNTPERPLVEDEERTVGAPVMFDYMEQEMAAPAGGRSRGEMAKVMAAPAPAMAASFGQRLEESISAVADGADRGALFAYRVRDAVSVARGRSAMVPLASTRLEGRRELLYNRVKHPKNPVASLRFRNESGLTLERGPVTVFESAALEGADYAGEAVIDFAPSGAEIIVAFAVELGVRVAESFERESRLSGLSVREGYLLIEEFSILKTLYELTSGLERAVDVILEHPRMNNMELFDTLEPVEHDVANARWKVACAAGAKTEFAILERQRTSRYETVRNLDGERLKGFLKGKFLDEKTFKGLEGVLALYRQADAMGAQLEAIERERAEIFERQKQIQGNLAPLGRDGDEARLRARYVKELERMENRLNELEGDEKRVRTEVAQLEELATRAIGALEQK